MIAPRMLAAWAATAALAGPAAAQEWDAHYRLAFTRAEDGRPQAEVEALLTWNRDLGPPPEEVELRMYGGYPGGYAAFVRDFEAFVPAGSRAPKRPFEARVAAPEEERFHVPVLDDGRSAFRYRVPLEHDPQTGLGEDETPHAFEDGVFWSGRALFVFHPRSKNRVTLRVPEGEHATVSWTPGADEGTYDVGGDGRLVNSFLLVGRHLVRTLEIGGSELQLALDAPLAPQAELVAETVRTFFEAAGEVYGGPSPERSVIALNATAPEGVFSGAVYGDDAHVVVPGVLDEGDPRAWRELLCHESFHLWNPAMVPLAGRQMWFSEGFTDYYAHLLLARTGLLSRAAFLDAVRAWAQDYLAEAGAIGLLEAGELGAKNRTLIYQGGALAALCLDIEIRRRSPTGKSLDDLMAALYRASGSGARRPVGLEDIRGLLEKVDGGFIARHVEGAEPLPLTETLALAGLELTTGNRAARLVPSRKTGAKARRVREALFGDLESP